MITYRKARRGDLPQLAHVYTSAYTAAQVGERWTPAKAHLLLMFFYAHQPDLFFVALENNIPVGAATGILKPWWDGNHISDGEIFVEPTHQKQGIASALLVKFIRQTIAHHAVTSIDWITFRNKEFPLSWYTRLGFAPVNDWVVVSGKPRIILDHIINNKNRGFKT